MPTSIDAERFDASVRDGLVDFYNKALHRDPKHRYGSTYDMQNAWRHVFEESETLPITAPFQRLLATSTLDKNPPHGLSDSRVKMPAMIPARLRVLIDQP